MRKIKLEAVMKTDVEGRKGKRPKNIWLDEIKCNIKTATLHVDTVRNRFEQRFRARVVNSK